MKFRIKINGREVKQSGRTGAYIYSGKTLGFTPKECQGFLDHVNGKESRGEGHRERRALSRLRNNAEGKLDDDIFDMKYGKQSKKIEFIPLGEKDPRPNHEEKKERKLKRREEEKRQAKLKLNIKMEKLRELQEEIKECEGILSQQ